MVKLVVHIGHGKTGSSSIQASLREAKDILDQQKVRYLGLMLENALSEDRKLWQRNTGANYFFSEMPESDAIRELEEVLENELRALDAGGIRTAIWSNEWILQRPSRIIPALRNVMALGHEVEVQVFLRRHDKWSLSAYLQWGLKHKTYKGPIRNYAQWLSISNRKVLEFYPLLKTWDENFGNSLRVLNFDSTQDVVSHFSSINFLTGVKLRKVNVSPHSEIAAAQAVFNSRFGEQVIPDEFHSLERYVRSSDKNDIAVPQLEELLPSAEELAAVVEESAEDIQKVNQLLERSGEPPLSFDTPVRMMRNPTPWEMDQFSLKLSFALFEHMGRLEKGLDVALKKIAELEASQKAQ